jgi:uncharacterized protein (TIGR04255 family)
VDLPEPDRRRLQHAPITLAVCQVRTEPNSRATDHQALLQIYEALGGSTGPVPRLAPPSKGAQPLLGPIAGPTLTIEQPGWRFTSELGDTTITVLEDSYSIETVNYKTWDDEDGFLPLLEQTSIAIGDHIRPAVQTRFGLRYVNQIVNPAVEEPVGWRGLIDESYLGPIVNPRSGNGVKGMEGRAALDIGSGNLCLLHYGSFLDAARPGFHTFLIDIDCYREGGTPFEVGGVLSTAQELNSAALSVFQMVTTDGLRDHLRGEDNS